MHLGRDRRLVAPGGDVLLEPCNASTSASGLRPSAVSTDAMWTKLTPSSCLKVAYRNPSGPVRASSS